MRDLDTAGRAVVDHPALPPTPVAHIESSARRRRRRRASIAGVLATVVVVAAVTVGFGISRRTSSAHVELGPQDPAAITDPQMRAHLGLDVPTSWVPVDYGDVRLFVPAEWQVTAGGCPGSAPAWVEVGGPYKHICNRTPSTFIDISSFTGSHETTPARVVHGYHLYAVTGDRATFVVPELHATIEAEGPLRDEALATLAPSSRLIALSYHAPVPSGWNEVGYSGITVSYPPASAATRGRELRRGSARPSDVDRRHRARLRWGRAEASLAKQFSAEVPSLDSAESCTTDARLIVPIAGSPVPPWEWETMSAGRAPVAVTQR